MRVEDWGLRVYLWFMVFGSGFNVHVSRFSDESVDSGLGVQMKVEG